MSPLTLQEVARATGGELLGPPDRVLSGVVADSRNVRGGELFVALPGARTDGHHFLDRVHAAGAGAALVAPGRGERPPGLAAVVVPDPHRALGELARYRLLRAGATVLGVTGTVGKTTAKDFLGQLLGGPPAGVHVAPASYNSEVGLPLAVLAAPAAARLLVLEYGVNAPGEMEALLAVARPEHACLTALTPVHLEGMGDLETIAREKTRLAAAVPEGGGIWLSAQAFAALAGHLESWQGRVHRVALDEPGGPRVLAATPGAWRVELPELGRVTLPLVARHEVELALLAAAVARQLGRSAAELRTALEDLRRPPGRLAVHHLGDGTTLLDDAYNASPAAMGAALEVLREWPEARRRVAVLGAMHELGPAARDCHVEVGRQAAACADLVVAVGAAAGWIATGAGAAVREVPDAAAVRELLRAELGPGVVVLVKASRAEGLDALVTALRARPAGAVPATGGGKA